MNKNLTMIECLVKDLIACKNHCQAEIRVKYLWCECLRYDYADPNCNKCFGFGTPPIPIIEFLPIKVKLGKLVHLGWGEET